MGSGSDRATLRRSRRAPTLFAMSRYRTQIVAHRGYSAVAPENTIAAIQAALDAGAEAVEVDLQTAIDGTPVLFHDPHLGRTTSGVGPVRRRTVGQLKSLDAGSWFSDEFSGERIPTLSEAVEVLDGRIERFLPEVKGYREMEDLDRMVSIIRDGGLLPRTTFLSMDRIVLDRIRDVEPGARIGYVVEDEQGFAQAVQDAGDRPDTLIDLELELALGNPGVVRSILVRDMEAGVWTVDEPEEAERLRFAGVTLFTTNRLDALLPWARSLSE